MGVTVLAIVAAVAASPMARSQKLRKLAARAKEGHLQPTETPYEVRWFEQRVDHFNAEDNRTFMQRYLVNDTFFTLGPPPHDGRPIFAMTGAEEGDVTEVGFWSNQFPFSMCMSLNGLCVFMEHRFFGSSLPFNGNGTFLPSTQGVGLLSVQQSLADYAALLRHLRDQYDAWGSKLITHGGSLSGTLAALMRLRYPEVVDGAYSSSSPILGWPGMADQYSWQAQIKDTFELFAPGCASLVQRGYAALTVLPSDDVARRYRTCEPPDSQNGGTVMGIATGQIQGLGLGVYPPVDNNIPSRCTAMKEATGVDDNEIFVQLIGTPKGECLNLTEHRQTDNSSTSRAWWWLSCTEVFHPIGCNNVTDMCPPYNYSWQGLQPWCQSLFSPPWAPEGTFVSPRPQEMAELAGVKHLDRFAATHSRVLFTYGTLDPWHTLGLKEAPSAQLPVIFIPNSTHCDDLAGDDSFDTDAMRAARREIKGVITQWLVE